MPGGRPSKYKPEYCDQLLSHMKQGLSFDSFAGTIGVAASTTYLWAKRHKQFSETKKVGEAAGLLVWEKIGMAGMSGKLKGFNLGAWCFWGKNRFGMRDVYEQKVNANIDAKAEVVIEWTDEDNGPDAPKDAAADKSG